MKEIFSGKPYPGRFIVIGTDQSSPVVIYGATGRSPSSLKRRFIEQGDGVFMASVDSTVAIEGNPELLEYPAVRVFDTGVVAANGNQIERIDSLTMSDASALLSTALGREEYEPDEYHTPRITGCIIHEAGRASAALHIVRAKNGVSERTVWNVPPEAGKGLYIATYPGEDVRPTPSFAGDPLAISLNFGSASSAVRAVYEALAPAPGKPDYRVGVVAVYLTGGAPTIAIMNTLEHA